MAVNDAAGRVRRVAGQCVRVLVLGFLATAIGYERQPLAQSMPKSPAPTPSPPAVAFPAPRPQAARPFPRCDHAPDAERAVSAKLRPHFEKARKTPHENVNITFRCTPDGGRAAATRIEGVLAHGHGGYVFLLTASFTAAGDLELRAVRIRPKAQPTLAEPAPIIEVARARIPGDDAWKVFTLIRTALVADVRVEIPAPKIGDERSISVHATTHDEQMELRVLASNNVISEREWHGYLNSVDEPVRAPLDLAWKTLFDLLPTSFEASAADDADKQLFGRWWAADHQRPEWVLDEQLALAPLFGTSALKPLAAQLESPLPGRRILAVNALAALTGRDLRRGANGAVRPLDEIVADYLKEFGRGGRTSESP